MAKVARATVSLPDEIVLWEILLRLPPKPLLRCRSVCRAWHLVTSARDFLLAHHGRQPSLPIFSGDDRYIIDLCHGIRFSSHYHDILAFDHRDATGDEQLHTIATLDEAIYIKASCDGLLVLSKRVFFDSTPCFSICNLATREHAPLKLPWDFNILGMYLHHPTGEYRLLIRSSRTSQGSIYKIGYYVFVLGSNQLPRYIGWPDMAFGIYTIPIRVCDNLHWCPVYYPSGSNPKMVGSKQVVVFDTIAESFRQMDAPVGPIDCYIFDMDGRLGIHSRDRARQTIDIWMLENYRSEVWNLKYRIKLPVAKIRREFKDARERWDLNIVAVDGGVLLQVKLGGRVIHVDNDGNLVNSFHRPRGLCMSRCLLKQSLVRHTFFPALEGYVVNTSPFTEPLK